MLQELILLRMFLLSRLTSEVIGELVDLVEDETISLQTARKVNWVHS